MAKTPNKYSQLVKDIEPLLVKLIRRVVGSGAASGAGSSGGGGVPIATHGLNSSSHTGTLGDYQAPQFLKTDGGRPLTGNLSTAPGVLIDGVDINVHAANPDAHHDRATSANGAISVTGQLLTFTRRTNSALLLDVNGVGVGAGNGLAASGETLSVRLAASNPGLILDASHLRLGTPLDLAWDSTSVVSGAGHSHAIVSAFDVGTTPAAALLRSTAGGKLTLRELEVKNGDLAVTGTGDLRVGAWLWADTSTQQLFVNVAEYDPQFTVDVGGALRATYLVGKHAIQLKDAIFIAHFDGPEKSDAGELNGHMGQIGTATGLPVFVRGKFGKAVSVGPVTPQMVSNPSVETNLTGWTAPIGGTLIRTEHEAFHGRFCARFDPAAAGNIVGITVTGTVTIGSLYNASVWLRCESSSMAVRIAMQNASGTVTYAIQSVTVTSEWQQFWVAGTPTQASGRISVVADEVETLYLDAVMFTSGYSYAVPFTPVIRAVQSYVQYNTSGWRNDRGTMMCWVRTASVGGSGGYILYGGNASDRNRIILLQTNNKFRFYCGNTSFEAATPVTLGAWMHLCLTWEEGTATVYINGVSEGSFAYTATAVPDFLRVGNNVATYHGEIDDVVVLSRASPADEVRSVYESDAPVFAETATWSWRATAKGLIKADEEGLWVISAAGDNILGVYADSEADGTPKTKSWGGVTLTTGDILFGERGAAEGGWMHFDQSAAGSLPALVWGWGDTPVLRVDKDGAFLDGVFGVSLAGGIYQGTGSFGAPATGLKIWRDGTVGRIAGYSAGAAQWYADTDGKLYAGGGNTVLDSGGLWMKGGSGALGSSGSLRWLHPSSAEMEGVVGVWRNDASYGTIMAVSVAPKQTNNYSLLLLSAEGKSGGFGRIIVQGGEINLSGPVTVNQNIDVSGRAGTAWANVSYGSGWGSYDANRPLQYKRFGDLVFLRGLVVRTSGSGTEISAAGALPAATGNTRIFATTSVGALAEVRVTTAGTLGYGGGGTPGTWIALDGIVYSTAA